MSGYGRPCRSHRLELDLVQSGFSENEGLSGIYVCRLTNRAPSRLSHGNLSCNKSGSFKSRVNTDFSVLIGYNYKGVTQGTCLLSFRCGVCNDVFDSRVQQTSEQHSNGKLKGKKPNQKLMRWCYTGAGEKGKKEEIRERGTLFPFALFSPSPLLPSPLWRLFCLQEGDEISRVHVVMFK